MRRKAAHNSTYKNLLTPPRTPITTNTNLNKSIFKGPKEIGGSVVK